MSTRVQRKKYMLQQECSLGKLHIRRKIVMHLGFSFENIPDVLWMKVPEVQKLQQQPEQQAENVSMPGRTGQARISSRAACLTAQCGRNESPSSSILQGCQHQKMLHHPASRSTAWWTWNLTLLPQETIPPGRGWGRLARVTEGACKYSCLPRMHPLINRT